MVKPLWIMLERGLQGLVTLIHHLLSLPVMHAGGRQKGNARVVMLMVVPVEKASTEGFSILNGTELPGKVRAIL